MGLIREGIMKKKIYSLCTKAGVVSGLAVLGLCLALSGCGNKSSGVAGAPSITSSRSSLRLMSIESVMPSSHLILCRPLLLLAPIPPSIRVFSNESIFRMRWPKYPSKEIPGLISFRMDWLDLLAVQGTLKRVFSNTTVQKHQFFGAQPSSQSNSHIHT